MKILLIYPIPFSSVIKLVFVRGCNWWLPRNIPLLIACTLPQHPAPNRRKHSSAILKSSKKMAENRVPLCSSICSESCFTFLFVWGKWRKSVPQPLFPSPGCTNSPAPKSREEERVPEGDLAAWRAGTAKGGSLTLVPLAGMDDHVTWGSQGRGPKSPAGESIHKWHLSYTNST